VLVARTTLEAANVSLWNSASPTLYTISATVRADGCCEEFCEALDFVSAPHGFRSLRYDANNGFFLNEQHFKKVFTFGGIPFCAMPPALRNNNDLLLRYMGEYRDLSTSCSVRSEGGDVIPPGAKFDPNSWVSHPKSTAVDFDEEEGRARFNWQDRKKQDLKGQPDACGRCDFEPVCEGVWKGYLDIYGPDEFYALKRG
jgi:hypothetical protein